MGSPSGAADSGRPAALAPAIIEALAVVRRKVRRDKRLMAVSSHDFGSPVSHPGKDRHDPRRSPDMILLAQVGGGTAGAAPDQHRHGPASRRAVRGGRRIPTATRRTTSTEALTATARVCANSSRTTRGAPATPASAPAATWRARSSRPGTGRHDRPADGIRAYEDVRENELKCAELAAPLRRPFSTVEGLVHQLHPFLSVRGSRDAAGPLPASRSHGRLIGVTPR